MPSVVGTVKTEVNLQARRASIFVCLFSTFMLMPAFILTFEPGMLFFPTDDALYAFLLDGKAAANAPEGSKFMLRCLGCTLLYVSMHKLCATFGGSSRSTFQLLAVFNLFWAICLGRSAHDGHFPRSLGHGLVTAFVVEGVCLCALGEYGGVHEPEKDD